MTEEIISESKDRSIKFPNVKIGENRLKKNNEQSLRYLWDSNKYTKIFIMGVPEKEKRKGQKEYLRK